MPKVELETNFVVYLGRLMPKPEYMVLFREIVLDTWKKTQVQTIEASRTLARKLEELRARKDRLVDAFVHRQVIDQITYTEQVGKVNEEIALTEIAAHDAKLEEIDVEGVLAFAEHVLLNAARLWNEFSLDQKQRLQRVVFPQGVTYREGEFGTSESSLLRAVPAANEREASPAGFEPTLPA